MIHRDMMWLYLPSPPNTLVNNCNSLQSKLKYTMCVIYLSFIYLPPTRWLEVRDTACLPLHKHTHSGHIFTKTHTYTLSQTQLSGSRPQLYHRSPPLENRKVDGGTAYETVSSRIVLPCCDLGLTFAFLAITHRS